MRNKTYYQVRSAVRLVFWTGAIYLLLQGFYSLGQVVSQWYK
jgi:hypothetical protein